MKSKIFLLTQSQTAKKNNTCFNVNIMQNNKKNVKKKKIRVKFSNLISLRLTTPPILNTSDPSD
jgi:hypothetical protein